MIPNPYMKTGLNLTLWVRINPVLTPCFSPFRTVFHLETMPVTPWFHVGF